MLRALLANAGIAGEAEDNKPNRYNTTKEQNIARTARARVAAQLNRAKQKLVKDNVHMIQVHDDASLLVDGDHQKSEKSFVGKLQRNFLTQRFFHSQHQEAYLGKDRQHGADRARSCVAMIKAIAFAVNKLYRPEGPQGFHTLCAHIVDDCSARMRGPDTLSNTTVYTVMNSIESVHVIYDHKSSKCSSIQIPTPLTIVDGADAAGIDTASTSTALVSAAGVGQLLQRFGVTKVWSTFKTLVFVGDSLKANNAAFQRECDRLVVKHHEKDPEFKGQMALRVRCAVHTVCLIRKPIVLLIPRFWTTLVRLSHLFESISFRKQLASCLTSIIAQSFVNVQSRERPEEFSVWRKDAIRVRDSFWCPSVRKRELLAEIIDFCNGDHRGMAICHYCRYDLAGKPCCEDSRDSLSKALRLLVPWFSIGFPVPLLYRFKHYDHAAGFVHVGTSLHNLLVRALSLVDTEAAHNLHGIGSDVIEKLMGHVEAGEADDPFDLSDLVLDEEESVQATNLKRKQLVKAEIAKASFGEATVLVTLAISPMEGLLNQLFKRSSLISRMTLMGDNDASFENMAAKSKTLFLDMMSGRVGWRIVDSYSKLLNVEFHEALVAGRLKNTPSCLQTIFSMVLICMTDSWRRFVLDHQSFPHILFQLVDTDLATFKELWKGLQSQFANCPGCVDDCFSKVILSHFPADLDSHPLETQRDIHDQVTGVLSHIASFAPLSSDSVECKNGRVQWCVSRRGNQAVKAPVAAREATFLQSAIQPHELLKHFVDERNIPAKRSVAGIIRLSGSSQVRPVSWYEIFIVAFISAVKKTTVKV